MIKIKLEIELEYDDEMMHSGEQDPVAKDWFFEDVLKNDLILHSNEIGDEVGKVTSVKIKHNKK